MVKEATIPKPVLVAHGGAGVIPRNTPKEKVDQYLAGMRAALTRGNAVLQNGGRALDAVMETVIEFEDNPLFNAGRGAVYTAAETHELDAAIMDGQRLTFGAACTLKHIKNPITLARKILEEGAHRLYSGHGAEAFAREHQLEFVANAYFDDAYRYEQLVAARQDGVIVRDHDIVVEKPMGTVGAVALDGDGNLAAATSTGGTTNKASGRVGDTAVPGAGNYANNLTCAVSCTGFGEEFMTKVAAYDLHARMLYGGMNLEKAANSLVHEHLDMGMGGLVGVDHQGTIVMPFNTPGMFRGYMIPSGEPFVKIWE